MLRSKAFVPAIPRPNFKAVVINGTIDTDAMEFSIILWHKDQDKKNVSILKLKIGIGKDDKYYKMIGV